MIIRVGKCSTFGIRKLCTKSVQYLPKLLINGVLIPCVENGNGWIFSLLGRFFDFNTSNNQHMSELSSLAQDLMNDVDIKPLHPKHKLLLYSRYVLSKLFCHFTLANISKTWITELLDSVVNGYIRKWPDIPISGTLSNVFLECNKFVLNICPPSIKFTQCQTVLWNSLKESPNDSLKDLWKSSSCHTNIQYDVYKSTKEVLKDFHSNQEDKLQHHLTSQGFFFSNVIKYSLSSVNSAWSEAQSHLPKNIYNFTIRYGTLTTPSLHVKTRTIWRQSGRLILLANRMTNFAHAWEKIEWLLAEATAVLFARQLTQRKCSPCSQGKTLE